MLTNHLDKELKQEVIFDNNISLVEFKKLTPAELVRIATVRVLNEMVPQEDTGSYIYAIFNGPNSEALNSSIKYYVLLKNGYNLDCSDLSIMGEQMDHEERFDPSRQITYDFYRHQEMLSKNPVLSIKERSNKQKMQKRLKDEIDNTIEEYMLSFAKHISSAL